MMEKLPKVSLSGGKHSSGRSLVVAYGCAFVPPEWISAHGFEPEKVFPSFQGDAPLPRAAMGLCPYAGAFAREVIRDSGPDAVVITTLCDQMRRIFEIIAREKSLPLFLMNVPSCWEHEEAFLLYISELKRLGQFLQRLGGSSPGKNFLRKVMCLYDRARQCLLIAHDRFSGRDFAEALSRFSSSVMSSVSSLADHRSAGQVPLALLGGPIMGGHLQVFDFIEDAGGTIVVHGTDNGERSFPAPFDTDRMRDDPFIALATSYFYTLSHPSRRPDTLLYQWIGKKMTAYPVKGIILWRYLWCDLWHAVAARLREWSPVPVLELEIVDGALLGTPVDSRTTTRIQAFIETLT